MQTFVTCRESNPHLSRLLTRLVTDVRYQWITENIVNGPILAPFIIICEFSTAGYRPTYPKNENKYE